MRQHPLQLTNVANKFNFILTCLILLIAMPLNLRADGRVTFTVTAYETIPVYAGPGTTYTQTDLLRAGVAVTITERNRLGNWLHVERIREDEVVLTGWVISGFLNIPPELSYGAIPVNTSLPDADTDNVNSRSQSQLYTAPVIPTLHADMIAVYEHGQEMGNDPQVITKVGDSLAASNQYLTVFSQTDYELGPYGYLEDTLLYYGQSTAEASVATRIGMSTYVVFDPFWATDERCTAGEAPLTCEYRLKQPSIAVILFGPNDVRTMTEDEYAAQMQQIITQTLDAGIIPVLMTFSTHPDEEFYWQSINFNIQLLELAETYNVPLINLWAAAQPLPVYGLDVDLIHLAHSGFRYLKYDTGHEARFGVSLQNLLVLRTLHEIRLSLTDAEL